MMKSIVPFELFYHHQISDVSSIGFSMQVLLSDMRQWNVEFATINIVRYLMQECQNFDEDVVGYPKRECRIFNVLGLFFEII